METTALPVTIEPFRSEHAGTVADLHIRGLPESFLIRLGRRFLAALYRGLARDPECAIFVARQNDRVVGFCACTTSVKGVFRRVIRRNWLSLGFASLPASLRPGVLREIREVLRYSGKQAAAGLPPAEILSIAVDEAARGAGVGRLLLRKAFEQAHLAGLHEIKVLAGARLPGANQFYQRCGLELRTEIIQHGAPLNVYVITAAAAANL